MPQETRKRKRNWKEGRDEIEKLDRLPKEQRTPPPIQPTMPGRPPQKRRVEATLPPPDYSISFIPPCVRVTPLVSPKTYYLVSKLVSEKRVSHSFLEAAVTTKTELKGFGNETIGQSVPGNPETVRQLQSLDKWVNSEQYIKAWDKAYQTGGWEQFYQSAVKQLLGNSPVLYGLQYQYAAAKAAGVPVVANQQNQTTETTNQVVQKPQNEATSSGSINEVTLPNEVAEILASLDSEPGNTPRNNSPVSRTGVRFFSCHQDNDNGSATSDEKTSSPPMNPAG